MRFLRGLDREEKLRVIFPLLTSVVLLVSVICSFADRGWERYTSFLPLVVSLLLLCWFLFRFIREVQKLRRENKK